MSSTARQEVVAPTPTTQTTTTMELCDAWLYYYNCYYCLLCEFTYEGGVVFYYFKKIKICNFRQLTIVDESYYPVTSID
jgi:hypothetical protein